MTNEFFGKNFTGSALFRHTVIGLIRNKKNNINFSEKKTETSKYGGVKNPNMKNSGWTEAGMVK